MRRNKIVKFRGATQKNNKAEGSQGRNEYNVQKPVESICKRSSTNINAENKKHREVY